MEEIKILAVDDETDILNLLSYNLKKAGFSVLTAEDGPEALDIAGKECPALIVLDIMLPNMEGTEVLKRLKGEGGTRNIPVIMLTAKGEEIDRIVGLELGADDYITKPFSPRELILRVRAILKRGGPRGEEEAPEKAAAPSEILSYGALTIDTSRHKVSVAGVGIDLTSTEFRLITELIKGRGRVLTRDVLLDRAWGEDFHVTDRTVDTHIRRLRVKLGEAGLYIETVRGAGYRFTDEEGS